MNGILFYLGISDRCYTIFIIHCINSFILHFLGLGLVLISGLNIKDTRRIRARLIVTVAAVQKHFAILIHFSETVLGGIDLIDIIRCVNCGPVIVGIQRVCLDRLPILFCRALIVCLLSLEVLKDDVNTLRLIFVCLICIPLFGNAKGAVNIDEFDGIRFLLLHQFYKADSGRVIVIIVSFFVKGRIVSLFVRNRPCPALELRHSEFIRGSRDQKDLLCAVISACRIHSFDFFEGKCIESVFVDQQFC